MATTWTIPPAFSMLVEARKQIIRSPLESGAIKTRVKVARPQRRWTWRWPAFTGTQLDTLLAFFDQKDGAASSFTWVTQRPHPPPLDAPAVSAGAAGSLNGAFDVKITFITSQGETTVSPLATSVSLVNEKLKVTAPRFYADVTSVRVYAAATGNAVKKQTTEITQSEGSVEYDSPLDSTTDPPSSNTALESLTVRFVEESLSYESLDNGLYSVAVLVEEDFP